ncbi:ribosomal protein 63, mitochondrial-like [Actinia tenebrosa]|uniref:Ribosomal protein 63, mitochondrial-like n=1 Tax=Actinia tenebrosa TaxID=6105 RepID=A0A6P8HPK9_ACTTE|nr:ribosomal protein 63, mitochondrial-like [Actinia tenebrosa]
MGKPANDYRRRRGIYPGPLGLERHLENFIIWKSIKKMWLTRILLGRRSAPGRIFAGKNRIIKKITSMQRRNTRDKEEIIGRVESLLSTPYLTMEEEYGHTSARKKEDRQEFLLNRKRTLGPNIYAVPSKSLTDKSKAILSHLNVTR